MKRTETSRGILKIHQRAMIVAIDFSKLTFTMQCRSYDGHVQNSPSMGNNGSGFRESWDFVQRFKQKHGCEHVVVGFESTGIYAQPFLYYMRHKPIELVQVNPLHTKKLKELADNSPNKTDQKDPGVIADIMELGRYLSVVLPSGVAAELRALSHARERALVRLNTLYNQLHDVVFVLFPEFLSLLNLRSCTARHLLARFASPQAYASCDVDTLVKQVKKVSRGRIGRLQVENLYQAASQSVGVSEGASAASFEVSQLLLVIATSEEHIAALEQQLCEKVHAIHYSRYLLSLKGVAEVTIGALIGEIADFDSFKSATQLLKYAGLNLFEISSGKHKGTRRISKRGRALIRKFLFFATLNLIREDEWFRATYRRHCDGGMKRLQAVVALMRKLLCVMHALVRNRCEYNVQYALLQAAA